MPVELSLLLDPFVVGSVGLDVELDELLLPFDSPPLSLEELDELLVLSGGSEVVEDPGSLVVVLGSVVGCGEVVRLVTGDCVSVVSLVDSVSLVLPDAPGSTSGPHAIDNPTPTNHRIRIPPA